MQTLNIYLQGSAGEGGWDCVKAQSHGRFNCRLSWRVDLIRSRSGMARRLEQLGKFPRAVTRGVPLFPLILPGPCNLCALSITNPWIPVGAEHHLDFSENFDFRIRSAHHCARH